MLRGDNSSRRGPFISQIIYPSDLLTIDEHAFLIGWNLDTFRCCVVAVIPCAQHHLLALQDALEIATNKSSIDLSLCGHTMPIVLGEWIPDMRDSVGSIVPSDSTGIWITLTSRNIGASHANKEQHDGRSSSSSSSLLSSSLLMLDGVPVMQSIFSLGCVYRTHCYMIRYNQPNTDYLECIQFSSDNWDDLHKLSVIPNVARLNRKTMSIDGPSISTDILDDFDGSHSSDMGVNARDDSKDSDDSNERNNSNDSGENECQADSLYGANEEGALEQSADEPETSRGESSCTDEWPDNGSKLNRIEDHNQSFPSDNEWGRIINQINVGYELTQTVLEILAEVQSTNGFNSLTNRLPDGSERTLITRWAGKVNDAIKFGFRFSLSWAWAIAWTVCSIWSKLSIWLLSLLRGEILREPYSTFVTCWLGVRHVASEQVVPLTQNEPILSNLQVNSASSAVNAQVDLRADTFDGVNEHQSAVSLQHRKPGRLDRNRKQSDVVISDSNDHVDKSEAGEKHSVILAKDNSVSRGNKPLTLCDISLTLTNFCSRLTCMSATLQNAVLLHQLLVNKTFTREERKGSEAQDIVSRQRIFRSVSSYCAYLAVDLMLGILFGWMLYTHATKLVLVGGEIVVLIEKSVVLKALAWFEGQPLGVKLNPLITKNLSGMMRFTIKQFRYVFNCDDNLYVLFLKLYASLGAFGLSSLLDCAVDIFRIMAIPIALFHRLSALQHSWQSQLMQSFWYLFQGKKINILRQRVDTLEYDRVRLLFGTMVFAIMVFVYPSCAVYFLLFAWLQLCVVVVQFVLWAVACAIREFPYELLVSCVAPLSSMGSSLHVQLDNSSSNLDCAHSPFTDSERSDGVIPTTHIERFVMTGGSKRRSVKREKEVKYAPSDEQMPVDHSGTHTADSRINTSSRIRKLKSVSFRQDDIVEARSGASRNITSDANCTSRHLDESLPQSDAGVGMLALLQAHASLQGQRTEFASPGGSLLAYRGSAGLVQTADKSHRKRSKYTNSLSQSLAAAALANGHDNTNVSVAGSAKIHLGRESTKRGARISSHHRDGKLLTEFAGEPTRPSTLSSSSNILHLEHSATTHITLVQQMQSPLALLWDSYKVYLQYVIATRGLLSQLLTSIFTGYPALDIILVQSSAQLLHVSSEKKYASAAEEDAIVDQRLQMSSREPFSASVRSFQINRMDYVQTNNWVATNFDMSSTSGVCADDYHLDPRSFYSMYGYMSPDLENSDSLRQGEINSFTLSPKTQSLKAPRVSLHKGKAIQYYTLLLISIIMATVIGLMGTSVVFVSVQVAEHLANVGLMTTIFLPVFHYRSKAGKFVLSSLSEDHSIKPSKDPLWSTTPSQIDLGHLQMNKTVTDDFNSTNYHVISHNATYSGMTKSVAANDTERESALQSNQESMLEVQQSTHLYPSYHHKNRHRQQENSVQSQARARNRAIKHKGTASSESKQYQNQHVNQHRRQARPHA